jgi:hypothetical protein
MTTEEAMQFSNLLFSHKHLWIAFQESRYLAEHPEMDYDTVHERFCEEAEPIYRTLADALLEQKPLQEALQTVLLHSELTEVEVRNFLKKKHP